MRIPSLIFAAIAAITISAIASGSERRVVHGQFHYFIAPAPAWTDQVRLPLPSELSASASGRILVYDTQFRVDQSTDHVHVRRVAQVREQSALDWIGQVQIQFNPKFQTASVNTLRVHRDGKDIDKIDSSRIRLLEREPHLEARVYSGWVTMSIVLDDLRVGDIVDIAYTLTGKNSVLGERFTDVAIFGFPVPVDLRRVRLLAPEGRRIQTRLHIATAEPKEKVIDGLRETVWEARDLPPVRIDGQYPRWHIYYPFLQMSEHQGWRDVEQWAASLFKIPDDLGPELLALIEEFRKAGPSAEDKVVAALRFVQNEVRYFATALGESSHRPAHPDQVFRQRYGDCKDKTILLVAILRRLGIDAKPALVSIATGKGVSQLLPSPLAFDHVITRADIDNNEYWIDATGAGILGPLHRRSQVEYFGKALVVGDGKGMLSDITRPHGAAPNSVEGKHKFTVRAPSFPVTVDVTTQFQGVFAEHLRNAIANEPAGTQEGRRFDVMSRFYPGIVRVKPTDLYDDHSRNTVTLMEYFSAPAMFKLSADKVWWAEYAATILEEYLKLPSPIDRNGPLGIGHPIQLKQEFEWNLPLEVNIRALPQAHSVRSPFFNFTSTIRGSGNQISGEVMYRSLADAVTAESMESYVNDLRNARRMVFRSVSLPRWMLESVDRAVSAITSLNLLIARGTITGTELAKAYHGRSRGHVILQNYNAALDDLNMAIQLNPNLADAYFERGSIYGFLKQHDRAIEDFDQAIRLNPNNPQTHIRRGSTHGMLKQYERAIQDFDQSIRLSSEDPQAHMLRGQTYATLKRYERAIHDLERAIRLDANFASAYNNLAWLLATAEESQVRDGQRALELALKACELSNWSQASALDTLASAYARNGNFAKAVEWQEKALEHPQLQDRVEAEERLRLYRTERAWPPD